MGTHKLSDNKEATVIVNSLFSLSAFF